MVWKRAGSDALDDLFERRAGAGQSESRLLRIKELKQFDGLKRPPDIANIHQ
jgi:hypothetical protein